MTTTLVYGDASDGYLHNFDATYAGARNGPADGVNGGTGAWYGQNNNGGQYTIFQTLVRFVTPAAPSAIVTAAHVRIDQGAQLSTGVVRDMELRGVSWSGGGLTTGDWLAPTALSATTAYGTVRNVQASAGKVTLCGSEALRTHLQTVSTGAEFVLVSSRQRTGATPTSDEGSSILVSDFAGTTSDPLLTYTTTPNHTLLPTMGGAAQLSDGSAVFLGRIGPPNGFRVYRQDAAGVTTQLGEQLFGTTSTTWRDVAGAQGLTLAVDASDNIYVIGVAGDAPNSLRELAFVKGSGWAWVAGALRTVALPSHDAPINNVTAAWHATAGGTLVIFAAHAAGDGVSGGNSKDLAYALISSQYLLTGSGTHIRAVSDVDPLGLVSSSTASGHFNGYMNEVGSGLDVVADQSQQDWGYMASFKRGQGIGQNMALNVGRYVLLSDGTGFLHASYSTADSYGAKDGGAKIRLLSVGSGQVALVSADADAGYGISVEVLQASGTTPGLVSLGYAPLAGESIPGMPDGPAVAASMAWDAVYSTAENAVWVYFASSTTPTNLRRTSVNLNTYQATRVDFPVYTASTAIQAVRVPRNAQVNQRSHVTVAGTPTGYAGIMDLFNLAPLAPAITPRANYDSTAAATFAWTFGDPNTGDAQSARRFVVERISDGVAVIDAGKVASSAQSISVAGGTLANGADYRWRVMTWDLLDVASPWSDWGTFSTSAAGSVNITAPAADNPSGVITDDYLVAWSATGTVQARYRVWVTRGDTGATVHDSGWVVSTATSATVAGMVSDVEHTIRVQLRNAALVDSGIGTRLITPSYGTPETPLVVLTPVPDGGYILVDVDNPIPGESGIGATFWDMEGAPDLASWYKNGGTLGTSAVQVYRGSQSAAFVSTGSGVTHAYNRAPAVNVTTGQRYAVRAWLYADAVRDVSLAIDFLTSGGAFVAGASVTTTLAAGSWTFVEAAGNCPAGATKASYGYGIRLTPAAGVTVWADDLRLAPASDRPEVVRNWIMRRRLGSTGLWEVLGECEPDGSFRDYTAPSHVPMEYLVKGETA